MTVAAVAVIGGLAMAAPALASTANVIDFETKAPCYFSATVPLTTTYAAQGVTFSGPAASNGGAILDTCSNFGVQPTSGSDFLAFNAEIGYTGPETISFATPVSAATMNVGTGYYAGSVTLTAFSGSTQLATSTVSSAAGQSLQPISVAAAGITKLVVSTTSPYMLIDDLSWSGATPLQSLLTAVTTVQNTQLKTLLTSQVNAATAAPTAAARDAVLNKLIVMIKIFVPAPASADLISLATAAK